jgi:plastocyanin
MRLRGRALLLLLTALAAAVVVFPAVAAETSPTVSAESSAVTCGVYYPNCWSPSQVEVTTPGTVTFQNASGVPHGVVWSNAPSTPSCSGVPVNSSATSFNGTCTFSQAGTYSFHCYVHGLNMSGTVVVHANGTTTTMSTAPPPASPGGGTNPTLSPSSPESGSTLTAGAPPPGSPLAGSAATALKLAPVQHGGAVRGSLAVSQAGAGGRLEIDVLARRAALSAAHPAPPVLVGRVVRPSVHAGTVSFSATLNARVRHSLQARRRLALTVKILLSPLRGAHVTIVRSVVLHR